MMGRLGKLERFDLAADDTIRHFSCEMRPGGDARSNAQIVSDRVRVTRTFWVRTT
jgi:hypothetical protein